MAYRRRKTYSAEYKAQLVELVREGRSPEDLAQEFEPHASTIRQWFNRAEEFGLRGAPSPRGTLSDGEKAELIRLRGEVARLREEREILKKAAAWFAGESVKGSR